MAPTSVTLPTFGAKWEEFSPPMSWGYCPAVSSLWGHVTPRPRHSYAITSTNRGNIRRRCSQTWRLWVSCPPALAPDCTVTTIPSQAAACLILVVSSRDLASKTSMQAPLMESDLSATSLIDC